MIQNIKHEIYFDIIMYHMYENMCMLAHMQKLNGLFREERCLQWRGIPLNDITEIRDPSQIFNFIHA